VVKIFKFVPFLKWVKVKAVICTEIVRVIYYKLFCKVSQKSMLHGFSVFSEVSAISKSMVDFVISGRTTQHSTNELLMTN